MTPRKSADTASQAARKLTQGLTLAWKALDIASAAGGESGRRFSPAAAPPSPSPSPAWSLIRVTDGPDRPLTVSNVLMSDAQAQLFRCCCFPRPHFRCRRLPPHVGSHSQRPGQARGVSQTDGRGVEWNDSSGSGHRAAKEALFSPDTLPEHHPSLASRPAPSECHFVGQCWVPGVR